MSNPKEREADDSYEANNDPAPLPSTLIDNSYAGDTYRDLAGTVPIQRDEDGYDDPIQPPYSNSDEMLGKDL
jgi:hypothetical protein